MKYLHVFIAFVLLSFSCSKGIINKETQYLEVINLTSHNVTIFFYDKYDLWERNDTVPIKNYKISANFSGIIDTAIIEYRGGEDDYCENVLRPDKGCDSQSYNLWGEITLNQVVFDSVKISDLTNYLEVSFAECDTVSLSEACVFISYSKEVINSDKKRADITEKTTYYITEQQYLLADSI